MRTFTFRNPSIMGWRARFAKVGPQRHRRRVAHRSRQAFWAETEMSDTTKAIVVLAVYGRAALIGALVGNGLGQTAK
jgi:hypothetical protein